ncbi:MAG: hypothetical protein QNL43_00975 [Crocinitomicaceae bacterium]|jgi:hypothetical protein|tara:strand:- start:35163 stop:35702 length:540 start_codon:yes stop_codon:yes gene_type:complete
MKNYFLLFLFLSCFGFTQAQTDSKAKTLVIGQFDRPEERYAIEVAVTDLFSKNGIPAVPSLNVIKQGANPSILATDSIQEILNSMGITSFAIVNVRGYDRRFKISEKETPLSEVLMRTSIYHVYREEATSVSFEFILFKENKIYYRDILKCGNVSDRDSVIKRIRKKLPKRISKKWPKN